MRIVVGVTGGIAAYKAVFLVRGFVLDGHDVHVVPTAAALRFVGLPTWEAISRNPVNTDPFDDVAEVRHVALGQSADLIVIAPATANSLAKLATGLADDLLGTTVLASEAPLVIAPAMHREMWENAATQANIATLRARGHTVVGPGDGQLTGDDRGVGRMSEPTEIAAAALAVVVASTGRRTRSADLAGARTRSADLVGQRILITAGGTREPLDPVRFFGNRSSGRQGVALAEAAIERGGEVVFIAANLEVPEPGGCDIHRVSTAAELREATLAAAGTARIVIMAAAVADYRPVTVSETKIKKQGDASLTLTFVANPDILAELGHSSHPGTVLVGFAAETEPEDAQLLRVARAKQEAKGADILVVNRVGWDTGFGDADNEVVVLGAAGRVLTSTNGSKMSVAHAILDAVLAHDTPT
ncbi:MAG: phosphopantothenoylcysteine decarboxylase [Candidatus Lumbricidophila eiseniae]|uniref:Coenzyme A biosynthesis bifunctional protein CoaBC n=1 Tax=Candidatus Lumbricidiphila eiseniae TaxID=1969409 RepID=A0A2A6FNL2_9MICO|nr:MAG: phosphopantothenoylcysteine decarboxylase [Candidatus Lumbricidophila eiseniae]